MAGAGGEEADAVLSDLEGEDPVPIVIKTPSADEISPEKFRDLLVELDLERRAREAAENSKSDLQASYTRLKALAHEMIKKRDECTRQRDEALREKEEVSKTCEKISAELAEANRAKDEALKQKEEIVKQLEEAVKERDGLRSDIGKSTHMLETGIEKISAKVSNFKNFGAAGLPRSHKYTGLAVVGLPEHVVKKGLDLIFGSKKLELEEKWKKLHVAELELYAKRTQLIIFPWNPQRIFIAKWVWAHPKGTYLSYLTPAAISPGPSASPVCALAIPKRNQSLTLPNLPHTPTFHVPFQAAPTSLQPQETH